MTKNKLFIGFLLIFLFAFGCATQPCSKDVYRTCKGCNPRVERFVLTSSYMDRSLKSYVNECVMDSLDPSFKGKEFTKGAMKTCIEKYDDADAETKALLLKELDKTPLSDLAQKEWESCRLGLLNPNEISGDATKLDVSPFKDDITAEN